MDKGRFVVNSIKGFWSGDIVEELDWYQAFDLKIGYFTLGHKFVV
jgi:hypothetical protein